jgi:hypothetical protein
MCSRSLISNYATSAAVDTWMSNYYIGTAHRCTVYTAHLTFFGDILERRQVAFPSYLSWACCAEERKSASLFLLCRNTNLGF